MLGRIILKKELYEIYVRFDFLVVLKIMFQYWIVVPAEDRDGMFLRNADICESTRRHNPEEHRSYGM
jgi:hypothetical protein